MDLNTRTKHMAKTKKQMASKLTSLQKKKMELEAQLQKMNKHHQIINQDLN